ncbi:YraN family protein [Commensalibacter oyaizuii]|uniref:UPF0102 protein QJV27_02490 n=1 Tax=Commensalibacter oyaizuii TaxID=3043873 RepID=A0ABT6PZH5_9PROT|nr:YraN family protein [Commensalibacter sp. TBRC 16381]MDI2090260.1 YraN family protein [Commensalibacter sp. TBRC 16381]
MIKNNKKTGHVAYIRGKLAEEIAEIYLIKKNWQILQRRFRCPLGEIDLIARKNDWLLFIEVKSRKSMKDALLALSAKQQRRLANAASYYLDFFMESNFNNIRFDLIAIDELEQIEHIKNITTL